MGKRGEVWQVDFGMIQKVRPAVVVSVPCQDSDRSLIAVVPHTTAIRGSRFEVAFPVRFLKSGAFFGPRPCFYSSFVLGPALGSAFHRTTGSC